jgi:D-glycero-alpha-D-manno-heptose-7-phosphate kinase
LAEQTAFDPSGPLTIRAKSPLRISFAGGGTDVSPYMDERGGVVLSATIDKYAYGTLRLSGDREITVQSFDYDTIAKYVVDEPLKYDGSLDLVKAVINRLNYHGPREGLEFYLHNDAPPGSGLGGSSAMVVALVGLFRHWRHLPLAPYEMAELAHQIERVDLGLSGGKQDQFATVFGGFNFIEFHKQSTIVHPLRIDQDVLNELDYNLLLCYTGHTRTSDPIIDTQIRNYVDGKAQAVAAMDRLKELTIQLKNALLRGRLDEFGHLLHDAWIAKKQMSSLISTPALDHLYEVARAAGALGGKITGAGGGGYMFFYCPFGRRHHVAAAIEAHGGQVVDFSFEFRGLQTWRVAN